MAAVAEDSESPKTNESSGLRLRRACWLSSSAPLRMSIWKVGSSVTAAAAAGDDREVAVAVGVGCGMTGVGWWTAVGW